MARNRIRPAQAVEPEKRKPAKTKATSPFVNAPGIDAFIRRTFPGAQYVGAAGLDDPYREDTRVFSAVSLIADSAASVPWRIFSSDPADDPDAQPVPNTDPVVKLLATVNPTMDTADLRERMAIGMELYGGVFWLLTTASGEPVNSPDETNPTAPIQVPEEIWPVSQGRVQPVLDQATKMPRAWRVNMGGGKYEEYPAPSVVHFRYPHPHGGIMGLAPMEVALRRANQIAKAAAYQDSILETGGDPGGIVIAKNMNDSQGKRLQQVLDEKFNDGTKAGDTRLLFGDVEYQANPIGPKDMQYEKLTEINWQAISEVFRVPATLLGMRSANYAEHKLHLREFWTIKMLALFRRWESTLNSRFFPRLQDARYQGYRIAFDTSMIEALQGELSEQVESAAALWKIGVPLNRALSMAGIDTEEIEGGDVPLVPTSVRPLNEPEPVADGPDPDDAPDDAAPDDDPDDDEARAATPAGSPPAVAPPAKRETSEEAFARRRAYERAAEARRETSDRRIAARVRKWSRKMRAAQITHLEKVAAGRRDVSDAGTNGHTHVMSRRSAESFLSAWDVDEWAPSDEGAIARWRRRHSRIAKRGDSANADSALLIRAGLTQSELDRLTIAAHSSSYWSNDLAATLESAFESAFDESARAVASELGAPALDATGQAAQKFLSSKLVRVSEGVNSTVAKGLQRRFSKLFAEVDSQGSLAEKIRELLPGAKRETNLEFGSTHRRARTIARTETAQIDSHVRNEAFKDAGIEKHEWVTVGDDLVRSSHAALDGVVRKISETFSTPNGPLRHANDPSGPAAEIINCRCLMSPVFEE